MDYLHAVFLALLQGLTEFLPISSSAHLILLPRLLGWEDQGLAFDVAVHIGTLAAVVAYFRHDVMCLLFAWVKSCATRQLNADAKLAWLVVLGTVPVAVAGLLFHDVIENSLRSPLVIAAATIGFGVLLGLSDFRGGKTRSENTLTVVDVVWIGLAQALALIPGTSRSGITMTAALALGLTRSAAARFSFLMSVPVILMAGSYESLKLLEQAAPVAWGPLLLGTLVAGASAYLSIHFFMRLIEKVGMLPFVIYRLLLGVFLLLLFV
ncbi:MAG: undecaprenyl-diphosphate phosphatase [Gammaproteobacteria bacterium]|jgi:undecaprenyl-diphosphatase|nr:undecaprenyl-diphosphate phosphatase [Gammaproteobacteria bacterium]